MRVRPKYIFVTGGVLSGLGKGIASASIGLLLKSQGFKVTAIKIDPYISIDAGTMRPAEHGEIFVTKDGSEIDQDIGHYERFLDIDLSGDNNITSGKVYQEVINKERHFFYKGRDAELIPDVINEIKRMIYKPAQGYDFVIVEIGGTTGDLENMPFLHAAREIGRDYPAIYIMVTYLPLLKNTGELKTKPTQHAVARLREIGIMPDFIITRNEIPIDLPRIEVIAKRCFVDRENIIDDPDIDSIYKVPLSFAKNKLAEKILAKFGIKNPRKKDLLRWHEFVSRLEEAKKELQIYLVGKYVIHGANKHKDVYISVLEALNHAAAACRVKLKVVPIDSESLEQLDSKEVDFRLVKADGIVVPQGWGSRGTEGKIKAARVAREQKIPYLGLCFGMQMAVVEFARNVLELKKANSTEINPKTKYPVIHVMPDQEKYLKEHQYGGTIRLGSWPCHVMKETKLYKAYNKVGWINGDSLIVSERHRHRYEFNNVYRGKFEKAGMKVAATSPDNKLVEAIEISDHPFFIGTQFHPEYQSRPLQPHPIFLSFIEAILGIKNYDKS
ncbi:MAG TPA: CTP synthase [Candidatus Bathyarchaeia archaeon]|nr:CTP synthase [Candidatus Bathyarchaeia archaeon]